jgi:hypothetical protein
MLSTLPHSRRAELIMVRQGYDALTITPRSSSIRTGTTSKRSIGATEAATLGIWAALPAAVNDVNSYQASCEVVGRRNFADGSEQRVTAS